MRGARGHRLAILLSLPTALLTVLAGFGIYTQIKVANQANTSVDNVHILQASQDLVHSLQRERGLTLGLISGTTQYRPQVDTERVQSNTKRTALIRLLSGDNDASANAVKAALGKLANLESTRAAVDSGQITRPTVLEFYTSAITALGNAAADTDAGQNDRELRRGIASLLALGSAKEATALERGHLNGVFASGAFTQDDYVQFTEIRAASLDSLGQFSRLASATRQRNLESTLRTRQATTAAAYERKALAGAKGQQLNVSPTKWWDDMTTVVDGMRAVQQGIGEDAIARAGEIKNRALLQLAIYAGGGLLTVALGLLLWLYTLRSIMRPLQVLTSEAHSAAERKLPDAVARIQAAENPHDVVLDTYSSALAGRDDEFSEVAEALDHLQATAVRLAVEQAVMRRNTAESLANLGRRNQNLVRRQLGFITDLEREEADPDALANLFKLDHLATRMRRNAESLLVLVGQQSPRRWSGSVAVGDVLRSAFAEVEDYQRVVLRRVDDTRVRGAVVAEVSHLLAELVENALKFSPPDQEVEIQAQCSGSQYHIAIVDQGVGMSPEAMATANARLRGEHSFLVAPTRDLGHYVVGHLAKRLGIDVWLHYSTLNGVTARVTLPAALLGDQDKSSVTARTDMPAEIPARDPARRRSMTADTGAPAAAASVAVADRPVSRSQNGVPAPRVTTRNGLIKRQPREHPLQRPERPPPRRNISADVDRSPGEVQSMLNQFRAGFRHGEQAASRNPGAGQLRSENGVAAGPATTRNGLIKRQPRERLLPRPERLPRRESSPPFDRSPNEVRSMLNQFRSGYGRGERTVQTSPGDEEA